MVEKLSKALEGLKNIQFNSSTDDTIVSKKEKMFFCILAADVIVSLKTKNTQNLAVITENMINLIDDRDADVRMVADESLNRIIMSLSQSDMLKVQVVLHNIIKKNGAARCLRAALTRFSQLSYCIRPNKGKAHIQMLIPALIEITKREEESIHETLALSLENIFKVLGVFIKDNILKGLIKAFLHNLSSGNPVIRRCSASSIITMIQYCRKPVIFSCFVLNSLLDCVVPICEENPVDLILGVLGCLRLLLPTLIFIRNEEGISGSFGLRKKQDESILCVDRLIQAYELCLHYISSKDHNVVAAALETLNQILQSPPHQLETFFLSPAGFSRSYIHSAKENRIWKRSESEMSVAFSLPAVDETVLLDDCDITSQFSNFSCGEPYQLKKNFTKFKDEVAQSEEDFQMVESPFKEKSFGKIETGQTLDMDSDSESVATSDSNVATNFLMRIDTDDKVIEDIEVECSRSNSQDDLYSPSESDKINTSSSSIDIGSFTDAAVPLIYCARLLAVSFLLNGAPNCLKSDRMIRVSIKSLALSCLSGIINLYPLILKMNLSKNHSECTVCVQEMSDILLFFDHSDPQIRGNICVLVGTFINSALVESKNSDSDWLSSKCSKLNAKNLIKIILKGLQDKSSVCIRLALNAFKIYIKKALFSVYNTEFLPLLDYLPALTFNCYWLVKVKLVEVLSDLPYVSIYDLTKSNEYQDEVIDSLLLLLGDKDTRVRLAAAEALVKVTPTLYIGKSLIPEYGKPFVEHLNDWLKVRNDFLTNQTPCPPFSAVFGSSSEIDFNEHIEHSLSIIVIKLTHSLLVPKSKHSLFGYLEALKLLSLKYPTTVYTKAWNCEKMETEDGHYLSSNLITVVLSLVLTSSFGLDLAAFSNATLLLGNLFAGHSISSLKTNFETPVRPLAEESVKLWNVFKNERISQLGEEILTHLLKVLNFYSHLVEEVTLSSVAESSSVSVFFPLLSPIKKQDKKSDEKAVDKKVKGLNNHKQSSQYVKLQKLLKNAYTNYKVSLDVSVGDKFLDLLQSTLYALSVLLEVATVQESGRCAEEILSYLRSVIPLRPNPAVICFIQLLKSLFGTNLACNWEDKKWVALNVQDVNLFDILFHLPTEFLSDKIRQRDNFNSLGSKNFSGCAQRVEKEIKVKSFDKIWLATYIRMFEPMVVKSQQLYTITADVELQSNVLRLLNQLIQVRINYCLLDGKQVFLDFVLKQFELIEHGQIPRVEALLPHVFKFLVLLSHEKQHSKPIMSIPKILQLCDGLMASDQPVQTHCIPALFPVVEDVFLSKSLVSSGEENELETQREVLLSMLLRLVEFPEVMDLLSLILIESKTIEKKEKWKRWSRQIIDNLLPLLNQDRLRIETTEGQISFARVMSSLSPNVLRPINPLLKALFTEPVDYICSTSVKRWLSKVTVLLETVLLVKEDALLNRLEETCPNINLTTFLPSGNLTMKDPFNVKSFFQTYESSESAARFILKVISVAASKIDESSATISHLQHKLSMFFVCTYYILKSGIFHKIRNRLQNLIVKEQESLARICSVFQRLNHFCPILTCQFSYFLTLLNYCDQSYWKGILAKPCTLSAKLVQSSGVISLSCYLCDNLTDTETLHFLLKSSLEELIFLSHEIPVKELFVTMQKKKTGWNLLLDTVSFRASVSYPTHFVERLLRLLEITESSHSWAVLKIVVEKFLKSPRLAVSLLAGSIACRQVEYLLTLPKENVICLIDGHSFNTFVDVFKTEKYLKRHSTLWRLLDKLSVQIFGTSIVHWDTTFRVENGGNQMKTDDLGENWYFSQVKQRCCQKVQNVDEVPLLLSKLSSKRILEIMASPAFNLKILRNCLSYSQTLTHKHQMQECENDNCESHNGLYKASKDFLLQNVIRIRKKFDFQNVTEKFSFSDDFIERFWEIAYCISNFLEFIYSNHSQVPSEWVKALAEFMILCFKVLEWNIHRRNVHTRNLEIGLKCCSTVVRNREVSNLELTRDNLSDCIRNLFYVVIRLIPRCRLIKISREKDLTTMNESDQMNFLMNFITVKTTEELLPDHLMNCLRDLVVNICRVPAVSSDVLKVPESSDMQDIDLLKSFISRFSVIGWNSRQQFEEIWVALLSMLGFNSRGDYPPEEKGFVVQVSTIAIEGITTLLKNTMLDLSSKKLIHHGRDSLSMKNVLDKLPVVGCSNEKNDFDSRTYQFLDNLEISKRDEGYIHGLFSVEYLWTAVKQISSHVDLYERHCKELREVGLDLPSCIHLLTELYNQWIYQASPDIKIVTSSLKSSIVISDLFTDIAQFQWLLNFCFRVDEIAIPEDTIILPLVILGCCKACAIVLPNEEICEKVKKLMLRSKSLPCKTSTVEGLLYLLQSYIVCYAVNHRALPPPGSTFRTDEANFVANVVNTFLPVAIDFVQEFKLKRESFTDDYERCHWSLIFYLLQHYQSSLGDLKEELLNFIITSLYSKNCPESITDLLVRGAQRLLLTTVIDESFREQLSKLTLEVLANDSVTISKNGLQLLSVLSFLDKRIKDIRQLVTGQEDPERVMKDMEKINVLFEKLRKSYPKEAEVVGSVISYILVDFTASDVLTKVIQEFLSIHQPHQKILAGLLFKVFERAEQSLLEDWVVFSLPNFIRGLPISMSIWTLNCFFVSSSREPWLRSLFPLVQSRVRMAEEEDKRLLCLSASHFHKQLKFDSQKKSFVETFEMAATVDGVFHNLLSILS